MQNYRECFEKVRKDCVKYIQSQETKKEKFKNKDQMIKSHIIPLCFWINKKRKDKKERKQNREMESHKHTIHCASR